MTSEKQTQKVLHIMDTSNIILELLTIDLFYSYINLIYYNTACLINYKNFNKNS